MWRPRFIRRKKRRPLIAHFHRSLIEDNLPNTAFYSIPYDQVREQPCLEAERYCFRTPNLNSRLLHWNRTSKTEIAHGACVQGERSLFGNNFLFDNGPWLQRRQGYPNHSAICEDVLIAVSHRRVRDSFGIKLMYCTVLPDDSSTHRRTFLPPWRPVPLNYRPAFSSRFGPHFEDRSMVVGVPARGIEFVSSLFEEYSSRIGPTINRCEGFQKRLGSSGER